MISPQIKMDFLRAVEADLRALSVDARRKLPVVKEAAERGILRLRAMREEYARAVSAESAPSVSSFCSQDLLRPFVLALNHGDAGPKLSLIALNAIQRLATHRAIDADDVPHALRVLRIQVDHTTPDVALKLLQTTLLLLSADGATVTEDVLAQALDVCCQLMVAPPAPAHHHGQQASALAAAGMVKRTASATICQIVALLFDRVDTETRARSPPPPALPQHENESEPERAATPGGSEAESLEEAPADSPAARRAQQLHTARVLPVPGDLDPAARAAFVLLQELCQLGREEPGVWLRRTPLPRPLALELIEAALSAQPELFRGSPAFAELLRAQVCPLALHVLRAPCTYPVLSRTLRIVRALVCDFGAQLHAELEVLLCTLLHALSGAAECADLAPPPSDAPPAVALSLLTYPVLLTLDALEAILAKPGLAVAVYAQYDNGRIFSLILGSLEQLVTRLVQLPQDDRSDSAVDGLLLEDGSSSGTPTGGGGGGGGGGGHGGGGGDDDDGDDDDDEDEHPPPVLRSRLLLLVVQALVHIVSGVDDEIQREAAVDPSGGGVPKPALHWTGDDASDARRVILDMATGAAEPLLGALSLLLMHCQQERLTHLVLKAYQTFTNSCGQLGLVRERDAFLASLCKFALPSWHGAEMGHEAAAALGHKHVQSLKTLFNIAYCLGGALGGSWRVVLDTFEQLDRVMHRWAAADDAEDELLIIRSALQNLFESTTSFDVAATNDVLAALAALSLDALNVDVSSNADLGLVVPPPPPPRSPPASASRESPKTTTSPKRSVSGAALAAGARLATAARRVLPGSPSASHAPAAPVTPSAAAGTAGGGGAGAEEGVIQDSVQPSFALLKLVETARHNADRLLDVWDVTAAHLCIIAHNRSRALRLFAVTSLTQLVTAALVRASGEQEVRLLQPLQRLVESPHRDTREATLRNLHQLLQLCGQSLTAGWGVVLSLLQAVAVAASATTTTLEEEEPATLEDLAAEGRLRSNSAATSEVMLGFRSLQLLVDDCLSVLPTEHLLACVSCVGAYGGQATEVNVSLTAINMLWTVTDNVAADTASLWVAVFAELGTLALESRPEVRNCALRTLFATVNAHGTAFSHKHWHTILVAHLLPLLGRVEAAADEASRDSSEMAGPELGRGRGGEKVRMVMHHSRNTAAKQWNETRVLALQGVCRILRSHYRSLRHADWLRGVWTEALAVARSSVQGGSAWTEVALQGAKAFETLLQLASTRGARAAGNPARAGANMRVVDGALAPVSAPAAPVTPPAEEQHVGDPELWHLSWDALEAAVSHMEEDVDGDVGSALVQGLGRLHESSRDCEFADADQLARFVALVESLARARPGPGPPPKWQPAVSSVQRVALGVFRDLAPMPDAVWPRLFGVLSGYATRGGGVSFGFAREAVDVLVHLFRASAPPAARAESLRALATALTAALDQSTGGGGGGGGGGDDAAEWETACWFALKALATSGLPALAPDDAAAGWDAVLRALPLRTGSGEAGEAEAEGEGGGGSPEQCKLELLNAVVVQVVEMAPGGGVPEAVQTRLVAELAQPPAPDADDAEYRFWQARLSQLVHLCAGAGGAGPLADAAVAALRQQTAAALGDPRMALFAVEQLRLLPAGLLSQFALTLFQPLTQCLASDDRRIRQLVADLFAAADVGAAVDALQAQRGALAARVAELEARVGQLEEENAELERRNNSALMGF